MRSLLDLDLDEGQGRFGSSPAYCRDGRQLLPLIADLFSRRGIGQDSEHTFGFLGLLEIHALDRSRGKRGAQNSGIDQVSGALIAGVASPACCFGHGVDPGRPLADMAELAVQIPSGWSVAEQYWVHLATLFADAETFLL